MIRVIISVSELKDTEGKISVSLKDIKNVNLYIEEESKSIINSILENKVLTCDESIGQVNNESKAGGEYDK